MGRPDLKLAGYPVCQQFIGITVKCRILNLISDWIPDIQSVLLSIMSVCAADDEQRGVHGDAGG